jgi:hypothetical protein
MEKALCILCSENVYETLLSGIMKLNIKVRYFDEKWGRVKLNMVSSHVEDILKIIIKVINFIASCASNKRQFKLCLKGVDAACSDTHVCWLSHGYVLDRFSNV